MPHICERPRPSLLAATLIRVLTQREMSALMSKFFSKYELCPQTQTQPAQTSGPFSPAPLFPPSPLPILSAADCYWDLTVL